MLSLLLNKNISEPHFMCDYVRTIFTKNCGVIEKTFQSLVIASLQ